MSSTDERVVSLKFDNTGFESGATKAIELLKKLENALKFDNAAAGFDSVKSAIGNFSMDAVSASVDACANGFSNLGIIAFNVLSDLSNRAQMLGRDILNNLTVKPLIDGFGEYELQMGSVQTILSNAGDKLKEQGFATQEEQIAKINETLDELNTYADKTIYNFSQMTRNIGTFTAAGVDLDTATKSIQGISNLAAASGSNAQQASTAMYQLSQAIAAGTVKLQDWNSVNNAGMGGELFQNALKRTARAHGIAVDEMIEKNGSFRESLQEGWITSDILTETLNQLTMTTEGLTDAEIDEMIVSLKNQGYSQQEAEDILELANNAQEAATKVRTWTQLWDTVGEALGSGWAASWRIIVGDFLEATDLFTHLSNGITGLIEKSQNARIAVLTDWAGKGGRTALVDGIKYTFDAIASIVESIGQAFGDVFGITGDQLVHISVAFAEFAEKLVPTKEVIQFIYDAFYNVFTVIHSVLGVLGNFVRIIFNIAGVVWKIIKPFAMLGAVIAGKVLEGIARLSSFILMLTDYIEAFVDLITSNFGSAIDVVYGAIAKIGDVFSIVVPIIERILALLPYVGQAFLSIVRDSAPVQFIFDSFKKLGDYLSGTFNSVLGLVTGSFDEVDKSAESGVAKVTNLSPYEKVLAFFESVDSELRYFGKGFLEANDKVAYVKDALLSVLDTIRHKLSDFFSFLATPYNFQNFLLLHLESLDSKMHGFFDSVSKYLGPELTDKISNVYRLLTEPILNKVGLLGSFQTWGDAFKSASKPLVTFAKIVKTKFAEIKKYFSDLFSSGKSVPDIIGTLLVDAFFKVKDFVTKIPELLSNLKNVVSEKISELSNLAQNDLNIADVFRKLLENLPSPSEVGKTIGSLVEALKKNISDLFSSANLFDGIKFDSIKFDFSFSDIFGKIGEYLSEVKASLPDNFVTNLFSNLGKQIGDAFNSFIENIDTEKIKTGLEKFTGTVFEFVKNNKHLATIATLFEFVHSLSSLNKGIGKFGKTFGKNLASFGESIGKGLSSFGEGFTSFKKQTKAQAFMRIATGMLILAGALWVLSKIPSDRLIEVATVLGVLAGAVALFSLVVGGIAKLGKLDLESTGKGIAGFGIGLLALTAAIWIFSKIPADVVDENMKRVEELIVLMALSLAAIAAAGGDVKGAAATAVAMAFAVILLLIPIEILGRTPDDVLIKGGNATGLILAALTGAIAVIELCNKNSGSILGAAPALLALAVATILMLIPIELLGREDEGIIKQGGFATGQIALVLASAVGIIGRVGKNAASILAGSVALLALSVATGIMIIPIEILGNMDAGTLKRGGFAAGQIAILIGGVITVMGMLASNAGAILAGSVAMIVLTGAVAAMALVVAGVAYIDTMNPKALEDGFHAVVDLILLICLGVATVAAAGGAAGTGLLWIAAGIAALGAALGVLAIGIWALQNLPDWGAITEGLSGIASSVLELGGGMVEKASEAFGAFTESVSAFAGSVGAKASEIVTNFVDGFKNLVPNLKTKASDAMNAFSTSISSKVGTAKAKANDVFKAVTNAFNTLKSSLKAKADDAVSGFVGSISGGISRASSAARSLAQAAKDGLGSLFNSFHSVGADAAQGLINGLGSRLQGIANQAAQLVRTAIDTARRTADSHSPSRVFMALGGDIDEGFIIGLRNGIPSVREASSKVASSVPDAFSDALSNLSLGIDDILDTDYTPEITPILNPTEFNSGLASLSSTFNAGFDNLSVGNLNYTGELSAKLDDYNDINRQAVEAISKNGIDYDLLGVAVANALIRSGVHVEIDGGQLMGYLAGEVSAARRQFSR